LSAGLTPQLWACLGDSLTATPSGSPTTILMSWPKRIDLAIWPDRGASNHAITGTRLNAATITGISMRDRFDNDIDGKGYYGLVLWGGVNDVLADEAGASILADYTSIVDDALAQGMKVIAIITSPAAGYTGGWSSGRQTALETLRTGILALEGTNANLTVVDFYQAAPLGLGDPASPTHLYGPYHGVASDGLHYGQLAQDQVIFPTLLPLMRAPAVVTTDSTNTFGVTAVAVRRHLFPQWPDFSTKSNPTAVTVAEMIDEVSADIEGMLAMRSVVAAQLTDSTVSAYKWCAQVIKLGVAIKIAPAVTGLDPAVVQRWKKEYRERIDALEKNGVTVLGAGASASEAAEDPLEATTHISEFGLETSDTSDMSVTAIRLRYDDEL